MMPQAEFIKMMNTIRQEYGLPLQSDENETEDHDEFVLTNGEFDVRELGGR